MRYLALGDSYTIGTGASSDAHNYPSILASRLRWLGSERVWAELDRLQELVDKTAGPRERTAMDYVRRYVDERT